MSYNWDLIAQVWFNHYGPLEFVAFEFDLFLAKIKQLRMNNTKNECMKLAYQAIRNRALLWLPLLMKVSHDIRIGYRFRGLHQYTPSQFLIFLAIEAILQYDVKVNIDIVKKMIGKICYASTIVKSPNVFLEDVSCCNIWRLAGVYYLYYENDIKRAIYCFKKVITSVNCDKIESLKHLAVAFTLINDREGLCKHIDKLEREINMAKDGNAILFVESLLFMGDRWGKANDYNCIRKFQDALLLAKKYIFDDCGGVQTDIATQIKKIFQSEKNINIMYNFIMNKECHWAGCNKKTKKLFRCKRCKIVFYCSKLCQKKDWKMTSIRALPHRQQCMTLSMSKCGL